MMSNTIRFREATNLDIPEIVRFFGDSRQGAGYWRARIEGYMKLEFMPHQAKDDRLIYVAVRRGITVGFVAGHLTKRQEYAGQIQWIATALQTRRVGIASELLWILAGWFIWHGVKSVRVDIDPENTALRGFYRHHCASSINRYCLYWDDIAVVVGSRNRTDSERDRS